MSQRRKLPSAKRCIRTRDPCRLRSCPGLVRKHRAPKGALRLIQEQNWLFIWIVRQKAPSAKRCIKTKVLRLSETRRRHSQKAPSAKRCIKTMRPRLFACVRAPGQKAPSAKRCIKTLHSCASVGSRSRVRKHRAP